MAYGVVETTKVTGLCFDFQYDKAIENGSLIAKGDLVTEYDEDDKIVSRERNIYVAKVPAVGDEVFLVANPAWSYDDSRMVNQNEDAYICPANKPFRAYGLIAIDHNKFAVEDYSITVEAGEEIAINDYIVVDGTTVKMKDVGATKPAATYGFVGRVVEIESHGFAFTTGSAGKIGTVGKKIVIEVIKNETVATA